MSKQITLKEARERLHQVGKTASDIGLELGVPSEVVRGVLSGRLKGNRGAAHKVAVSLGLKSGQIVDQGTSVAGFIRTQAAA